MPLKNGFVANALPGCLFWMNPANPRDLSVTNGLINQALNHGSTWGNLTATGANRPSVGSINTLTAIRCNGGTSGAATMLTTGTATVAQPVRMFAVVQNFGGGSVGNEQIIGDDAPTPTMFGLGSPLVWTLTSDDGTHLPSSGVAVDTKIHVYENFYNGASSQMFLDGVQIGSTADAGSTGWSAKRIYIGSGIGFTSGWNGLIGEVLIYDNSLSATQVNTVRQHLYFKWVKRQSQAAGA